MTMSIDDMKTMLLKLEQAKEQLTNQINQAVQNQNPYYLPSRVKECTYFWDSNYNPQDVKANNYQFLNYDKTYSMVTLTFDPSISKRLSFDEQLASLTYVVKKFSHTQYFACFEKHMNHILHAHILLVEDPVKLTDILHAVKSRLTPSRRLMPAVNVRHIPRNVVDVNRTYGYIFDHKKDHPVFKHLIINI